MRVGAVLGVLGTVGDVADVVTTASTAYQQYKNGDIEGATDTLGSWGMSTLGGMAGGAGAGALAGIGIGTLVAAGLVSGPIVPLNDILPPLLRKWFFRRCLLPSPYKTVRNLTYQYLCNNFFGQNFLRILRNKLPVEVEVKDVFQPCNTLLRGEKFRSAHFHSHCPNT